MSLNNPIETGGVAIAIEAAEGSRIPDPAIREALAQALTQSGRVLRRILVIPPDYTRFHSYAGTITAMLREMLHERCQVDILPALGTHQPVTPEESRAFFGPGIDPASLKIGRASCRERV